MTDRRLLGLLVICLVVSACASPAPEPTALPTAEPTEDGRVSVGGYFSFVPSLGYTFDLEDTSAYLESGSGDISVSLAIIGVGEDTRELHSLLESVFDKFEGVDRAEPFQVRVSGQPASLGHFNGVLGQSVVSGSYVVADLADGTGLLVFAFGSVTEDQDAWQDHGSEDFFELIDTIKLSVQS